MDFMTMRTFLRGGYARLRGPTLVVRHGIPVFTVMPHGSARAIDERIPKELIDRPEPREAPR